MPDITVHLMPEPKPPIEMFEETAKEMGWGDGVTFKSAKFLEKEPDTLSVTFATAESWQPEMRVEWKKNILQGYAQMSVVETLHRFRADELAAE